MPDEVVTRSPLRVTVNADHRNGICEKCTVQMEVKEVDIGEDKKGARKMAKRPVCPECGGMTGQLISKPYSIQPPSPPRCMRFKCVIRFMIDSLYVAYLSSYHRRRVAYAEARRPDNGFVILERYRTGDPSPENLWQAIHANIKLKCPVCRKYNKDPFLFKNKNKTGGDAK